MVSSTTIAQMIFDAQSVRSIKSSLLLLKKFARVNTQIAQHNFPTRRSSKAFSSSKTSKVALKNFICPTDNCITRIRMFHIRKNVKEDGFSMSTKASWTFTGAILVMWLIPFMTAAWESSEEAILLSMSSFYIPLPLCDSCTFDAII